MSQTGGRRAAVGYYTHTLAQGLASFWGFGGVGRYSDSDSEQQHLWPRLGNEMAAGGDSVSGDRTPAQMLGMFRELASMIDEIWADTPAAQRPVACAASPVQRALLTPQANPGPCYHRGKST